MNLNYIIALLFCGFIVVSDASAQETFYNNLLQETSIFEYFGEEFNDLDYLDVDHKIYTIDNNRVVEFYDRDNDDFLGIMLDPSKVEIFKTKFAENNKQIAKLLKLHSPDMAMAIYSGKPVNGMTTQQVEDLCGQPDSVKYKIKGTKQVLKYSYEKINKQYYFLDGKLVSDLD